MYSSQRKASNLPMNELASGSPALAAGNTQRTSLIVMTVFALWLASHPWRGFWHDAVLYSVQALRYLYPANFQHDLYFLHGSQDAFTVFSPLYAAVIKVAGQDSAGLILQVIGSLLWVSGAVFLLRPVLRGLPFWLGLTMLFIWPTDYGPDPAILRLGESFLTPRLYAEGLGMLALGCFVRGRTTWGMVPACLAFALHPLVACAPLLVGVLYLFWGKWRAMAGAAILGSIFLATAAKLGVQPFDRLAVSMDADWFRVVNIVAPMVSWKTWHTADWISRTFLALSLVLIAYRLAGGVLGRMFLSTAVAGAIGILANWVGTGLTDNQLLIQLQPWRMLWLAHLCSWIALAWLFGNYWHRERVIKILLLSLCLAALTRDTVGGAVALLAGASLCYCVPRPPMAWPSWGNKAALAGLTALLFAWFLEISRETAKGMVQLPSHELSWVALLWFMNILYLGLGAAAGTGLLLVVWRWCESQRKALQLGAFALVFATLCFSAIFAVFPARHKYGLTPDGKRAVQQAFLPLIPVHASMYWENNVLVTWYVLHRSSYASNIQLTGVVFNRGTAIEGARRMERLRQLGGVDSVIAHDNQQTFAGAKLLPEVSQASLSFACADPALDYVVLTKKFESAIAQARDAEYDKTYYLYDCSSLRKPKAPPGSGISAGAAPGDSLSTPALAAKNK